MDRKAKQALEKVIAEGNYKNSLIAIRNFIAEALAGGYCDECGGGPKSGAEVASLTLRLTNVLELLKAIDDERPQDKPKPNKDVISLAEIRARRNEEEGDDAPALGTKSAPRRQGGRRPRKTSE